MEKRNRDRKLKERMIPAEWRAIERDVPVRPRKLRVTAAYDEELVKWFRAMGQGYQARMNAVLQRLHAGDEVAGDRQPEGPRLEGGRDLRHVAGGPLPEPDNASGTLGRATRTESSSSPIPSPATCGSEVGPIGESEAMSPVLPDLSVDKSGRDCPPGGSRASATARAAAA